MQTFLDEDFLLGTETAKKLYHDYAEDMPIFDYHCHLPVEQIADNTGFESITGIWLGGDHYKWRAMRANGISEHFITGNADDWEKFRAWASTVPRTIGNPLYHWSHLELKNHFGIVGKLLNPDTAEDIYRRCNELLKTDEFRVRAIMERMRVKAICTTDDPTDSLEHHKKIRDDGGFSIKVFPAFRPDKAVKLTDIKLFNDWVGKLEKAADISISDFKKFLDALKKRLEFFHGMGCRISDHGLDAPVAEDYTEKEVEVIFSRVRARKATTPEEKRKFATAVLLQLGRWYAERSWAMQLHFGAMRNTNTRMFRKLGPDTGFDSIGDWPLAELLAKFLDYLDSTEELPKTIIYNLNPAANDAIATMIGNFQDGSVPGKMQFGAAWWFNDQKDGMERQLITLANQGLLSRFVGMCTDSRSFLSYPRHEYFRRILCNLIGRWVEDGEAPKDMELLGEMVQDICYNNARNYFGMEV